MFRRRWSFSNVDVLPADPALLSEVDSVGSDAPVDRRLISSDDVVVCHALLARSTVGVERPCLRTVVSNPFCIR